MIRSSKPMEIGNSKSGQAEAPLLQTVPQNLKKEFEDVKKESVTLSAHAIKKNRVFTQSGGPEASEESLVLPKKQRSRVQVPTQNLRSSPDDQTLNRVSSKAVLNPGTTLTPKSSKPMETGINKSRQTELPLLQKVARHLKKEFEDVEEQGVAHSPHAPEKREVVIGNGAGNAFITEESLVLPKKQRSRVQASPQNLRSSSDNRMPSKETKSTRLPEIGQKVAGNDQEAKVVNSEHPGYQGVGEAAMRHIEEYIEGIPTGKAPFEPTKSPRNSSIVLKSYKKLGKQNEPGSSETRADNHPTQSSVALKKYVKLDEDSPNGLISAGKTLTTAISHPVNLRDQLNHEIRSHSLKKHMANGISHVAPVKRLVKQGTKLLSPLNPVINNLKNDIQEVKMIPEGISENQGLNPSTYIKPVVSNLENKLEGVEKKILESTEFSSFLPVQPQIPRGPSTYIKNHYKSPALPHPYHLTFWLKKEKAESQK